MTLLFDPSDLPDSPDDKLFDSGDEGIQPDEHETCSGEATDEEDDDRRDDPMDRWSWLAGAIARDAERRGLICETDEFSWEWHVELDQALREAEGARKTQEAALVEADSGAGPERPAPSENSIQSTVGDGPTTTSAPQPGAAEVGAPTGDFGSAGGGDFGTGSFGGDFGGF